MAKRRPAWRGLISDPAAVRQSSAMCQQSIRKGSEHDQDARRSKPTLTMAILSLYSTVSSQGRVVVLT